MLVDWFTVGAQLLNFLILVWLLKRYLYKPILDAIDAREARIALELANADAKKTEAQKERDEFKHRNDAFDQQRELLLSKATDEAMVARRRLIAEARQAADDLTAKRRATLANEARVLSKAIAARATREVFEIARKTLMDLAGEDLEDRVTAAFIKRLRALEHQDKATLGNAIKSATGQILVRSAFDLAQGQRAALQTALAELFASDARLHFEATPDLISGIELTVGGQKVAWSIKDYLASLEEGVGALVDGKEASASKPPHPATIALEAEARTH